MSIPPLVCSTPPPLEQCEEDKDPEDFDLQYNLSQEDYEDNYDYGNFSTYNHFQAATSVNEKPHASTSTKIVENVKESVSFEGNCTDNIGTNNTQESKFKFEEEINIEDLNLKVDDDALDKPDEKDSSLQDTTDKADDKDNSLEDTNNKPGDKDSSLQDTLDIADDKDSSSQDTIDEADDTENSLQDTIIRSDDKDDSLQETIDKPAVRNSCLEDDESLSDSLSNNTNVNRQEEIIPCALPSEEFIVASTGVGPIEEPLTYDDELIEPKFDDLKLVSPNKASKKTDVKVDITENIVSENVAPFDVSRHNTFRKHSEEHSDKVNSVADNDFDFDDFQFASDDKPETIFDNFDNPWDSKESEDNDFGNFKANFDENSSNLPRLPELKSEYSKENSCELENQTIKNESIDDFGDFDDFKSCATESTVNVGIEESLSSMQVPVLNLQSPDNENHVIESINKVLSTIYENEISEPDNEFEGNLDTMLGETWGHLLETDERQPYVVIWNNSLGQKTLLKALCIDSRNILFGPKWSYSMPKYAVNMGNAPLQPQKPSTSANLVQNESLNPDKSGTKTTDTWSDPFTSDGQESCNTDSGKENAAMEIGPTDLDVFEASVSSKSDKIFSSTMNVQPMRQINLPDTHIFTPTDSETPRSKTIHYDSSPAGLFPQTVTEISKNQSGDSAPPSGNAHDNEYWEFQDFKGTSNTLPPSTSSQEPSDKSTSANANTLANPNVTHKTAVLQPIKVEPIMPTLNWPDPGEVKETFDDFSDFVANSSWSTEKQDIISTTMVPPQLENIEKITGYNKAATTKNETATHEGIITNNSDSFDDEFDTFQSALPSSSSETNFNNLGNNVNKRPANMSLPVASQEISEISNANPISFVNATTSKDNFVQNPMSFIPNSFDNITNKVEDTVKMTPIHPSSSQLHTGVLQPTPSTSGASHNQQKSAQILQPLSLESYSQINWPNPGIDLQDLSRFNPVETLQSLKSDLSTNSHSKRGSPVHNHKSSVNSQPSDDDIWGEFVSSKPKQQALPKKSPAFVDDDEWTDFVSSPSVKPQNGLKTISLNVHTNLNSQKASNQNKFATKSKQISLDIPSLNYITPKSNTQKSYNDRHFQNL